MRRRWRPRLTPYRLLTVASVVSFGIPHAIYAERNKPTSIVPIWLDWIFGVIVLLILYLGSIYERDSPESIPWLFQKDFGSYITNLLESENSRTSWESDERVDDSLPITPYRLLVSAVMLAGGTSKVIISLQGHGTVANTVDWSFGIFATIFLYCLGWFEFSSTNLWSPFFAKDCGPIILKALSDHGPMVFALGVIYPSAKWTLKWSSCIAPIWNKNYEGVGLIVELFGWFPGLLAVVGFADSGILVGIVATLILMKLALRFFPRFHIRGYKALRAVLSILLSILFVVDTICLCIAWLSFWWMIIDKVVRSHSSQLVILFGILKYLSVLCLLFVGVISTPSVGALPWLPWKIAMTLLNQYFLLATVTIVN